MREYLKIDWKMNEGGNDRDGEGFLIPFFLRSFFFVNEKPINYLLHGILIGRCP